MRIFVLAIILVLTTLELTHAQTAISAASAPGPIATAPGVPPSAGNSSGGENDPALNLRGMPCSVSLNATGGITTSSSCGSDPLEVPARTIVSPDQVNGSQPLSVQTSGSFVTGGTQSSSSAGGTTSGSALSRAGTASTSSAAGVPSPSALCSTTVSATGGPTGAASLIGGC